VAKRLETAELDRIVAIAAAHRAGLSVRQIAAAVRLSPARVHQLLHAPASAMMAQMPRRREDGLTSAGDGSSVPLAATAALVRECSRWLESHAIWKISPCATERGATGQKTRVGRAWQICCRSRAGSAHVRNAPSTAANSAWIPDAVQKTGRRTVAFCAFATHGPT
jgi:hypothetical protein